MYTYIYVLYILQSTNVYHLFKNKIQRCHFSFCTLGCRPNDSFVPCHCGLYLLLYVVCMSKVFIIDSVPVTFLENTCSKGKLKNLCYHRRDSLMYLFEN